MTRRLQYSVIGHYTPIFGSNTSRARELVMHWYIDNIMSLHTAKPIRRELVRFFVFLNAPQMGAIATFGLADKPLVSQVFSVRWPPDAPWQHSG